MSLDKINKWLSLISNIGVLLGIAFLALEISQSNRIAERDGRSNLVAQEIELQQSFLENLDVPQLMLKLSDPSSELTPLEIIGAESFAAILFSQAANINISYETNLLTGRPMQRQVSAITANIDRMPGVAKYLAPRLVPRGRSPVFDLVWETIENVN